MIFTFLISIYFCFLLAGRTTVSQPAPASHEFPVTDCGEPMSEWIKHSINREIPHMLEVASHRMSRLVGILENGQRDYRGLDNQDAVTRRTFSNMIYQHDGDGDDTDIQRSISYLQQLVTRANDLRANLKENRPLNTIHISCSHQWLIPQPGEPNRYSDGRTPPLGSSAGFTTTTSTDLTTFDRPSETDAEVIWDLSPPYHTVLLVNKHNQFRWQPSVSVPYYPYRVTYEFLRQATTRPRLRGITETPRSLPLMMPNHLSAALLPELTQTWVMSSGPNMVNPLKTEDCKHGANNIFDVHSSFGIRCVFFLARDNPDTAVASTLNFKFLVVALYLEYADWSTGVSRPVHFARYDNPLHWEESSDHPQPPPTT